MGWNLKLTNHIVGFGLTVFIGAFFFFPGKLYDLEWIMAAFIIFAFAFYGVQTINYRWNKFTDKAFINRLFWLSFGIRMIVVLVLLSISYKTWDMFYYVGAMDEMKYYRVAGEAADIYHSTGIIEAYNHILDTYKDDISDTGFCTFQAFLMVVFNKSPFIFKIIYASLASLSIVRLYKLSVLLFDRKVARLGAVLFMFFPISWFFSAVMMKEATMILLIVEAVYSIVKLRYSYKYKNILKLLALIILLFFFRSSVSILLIFISIVTVLFTTQKRKLAVNIIVSVALLGGYIYFLETTGRAETYYNKYADTEDFVNARLMTGSKVNPYTALATAPVSLSISLFAPFPSFVSVPISFDRDIPHDEYYYHVAGCLYWVVLSFFSIIGLYYGIKLRRKDLAPILLFILGYQFILFRAILFTSVRFTYPVKPFLILMAAYGVYQLKDKRWFSLYLIGAFFMVIGWNYVRLLGRGG